MSAMGEEADADWQAGLVEWGIEDANERQKPTCRCGRPATIITKPSMLLCDKCARKIFPRAVRRRRSTVTSAEGKQP